jgi:hypothetical protein
MTDANVSTTLRQPVFEFKPGVLGHGLTNTPEDVIAIDGKTLRRFYQKKDAADDPHRLGLRASCSAKH